MAAALALVAGLPGCATDTWRTRGCEEVAAAVEIRFDGAENLRLKQFGETSVRFGRFVLTNGSRRTVEFSIWSCRPLPAFTAIPSGRKLWWTASGNGAETSRTTP